MDPKVQRVVEAGRAAGIEVEPRTFPEGTRTSADAAAAVGCEVAQIVKSLVFDSERGPILFLVSGANRVDAVKAASAAGVERLQRCDAETAKRATGFSIGATPPFGHVTGLPVLMDEDLLQHEQVWAAAGRPDSVFPTTASSLARATKAKIAALAEA